MDIFFLVWLVAFVCQCGLVWILSHLKIDFLFVFLSTNSNNIITAATEVLSSVRFFGLFVNFSSGLQNSWPYLHATWQVVAWAKEEPITF